MRASQAGTDQAIEGEPELAYLRTALAVAAGSGVAASVRRSASRS
jgi:hypothetical protein